MPETSIADWLKAHAPDGGRIGYDPWLHTRLGPAQQGAGREGRRAGRGRAQPDRRGLGRPARAVGARLVVHPDELAGKSSAAKRQEMADWLQREKADAAVLSALDSIAWTFNIRGAGRRAHPGRAVLRAGPRRRHRRPVRRPGEARRRGPPASRQRRAGPRARRVRAAAALARRQAVAADPERAVAAIFEALEEAGAKVVQSATRPCCPRRSRTRPRSPATAPPRRATARR